MPPIDDRDIERLKEIFVTRQECNTQMDDVSAKLSNDNARLAVIETKIEDVRKFQWIEIAGIAGAIIAALMGVILK